MKTPITVLAPIKLAAGKTEADLLAASDRFQEEFVSNQPGVLRRELVRKAAGEYIDIVQFQSSEDVEDVTDKEKTSTVCQAFFAVMDMSDMDEAADLDLYPSLATYP